MPMHLLLSGSGFFTVGRNVPRLRRIDVGVPVLRCEDPTAMAGGIEFGAGLDDVQIGQFAAESLHEGPHQPRVVGLPPAPDLAK